MTKQAFSILIAFCIVLLLSGCRKDGYLKNQEPFMTGQTDNAYFRFIDSGARDGLGMIDLDLDGKNDIALSVRVSKSPGSTNSQDSIIAINKDYSIYCIKEELSKHTKIVDTVIWMMTDTIVHYFYYYNTDTTNHLGIYPHRHLPVLYRNTPIDTFAQDDWVDGINLSYYNSYWKLENISNHFWKYDINSGSFSDIEWGNEISTYIALRKKVRNNYKFGWLLINKDLKIISAAMQK